MSQPTNVNEALAQMARLQAQVEQMQKENERLKAQQKRGVSFKVSDKGALSVYGLGRFPVTLYKSQWTKLIDVIDDVNKFMADNSAALVEKDAEPKAGRPAKEATAQ